MTGRRVTVLGAGCVGLATAWHLLDADPKLQVEIVADKFGVDTTTAGCGGFWEPHALGDTPVDKIRQWSGVTFDHLVNLAVGNEAKVTGTHLLSGYSFSKNDCEDPWWKDMVFGFRHCSLQELRLIGHGRYHTGWFLTTVKTDCLAYLAWMMDRLKARGVRLVQQKITDIMQLAPRCDVVVNCCGLEARSLVGDKKMQPIRGQIMRVSAPWVHHYFIDRDNGFLFFPAPGAAMVGGLAGERDERQDIRNTDKHFMMHHGHNTIPAFQDAEVLSQWVGVRPGRSEVRLLIETLNVGEKQLPVVHNYGHGGGGVTLHWGCGKEAAHLTMQALALPATAAKL